MLSTQVARKSRGRDVRLPRNGARRTRPAPLVQSAPAKGASVVGEASPPDRDVLVALNRAVTIARLMSGTVHEVNNALQVIGGSVELLETQPDLPPPVLRSLDRIKRQNERAAAALAELLAFSKASLDDESRFSVKEVVLHAVALRRYAIARLGLTIEVREDGQGSLVVGNAGYVEQALINLIINAEQAMAGKGGAITVSLLGDGTRVGIEVADTGAGLSAEAQARLFQPFSSTKEPREGSGLGLWTTRTIAESFGGQLEIRSDASGTTATLWLTRE